ncbi:hypothetical protein BI198_03090 [Rheinheimera salexigens]|uniref:DUF6795 domain-containing protein n=2 Tax=Rheinheimera salexigens TaxID=1628148 RepID=A0A1E7QA83_9GAMM|nr:hypothetical protein BI198_03090 [Rheinheimera salexigens]
MLGWLKSYDVHLSPEIKGKIMLNGKPLAGVTIYRSMDYHHEYVDSTISLDDGAFNLPMKNIKSRLPGNKLDQSTLRLVISTEYLGKEYLIWYSTTPSIEPHQSYIEKLAEVNCDLTSPELIHEFINYEYPNFPHSVHSICRWQ